MAVPIGLADIAKMLSTKGGDISTIGGAIGCMSAMISADARDKENTTSNDVKKIQEYICGGTGGGIGIGSILGEMSATINNQYTEVKSIADDRKSRKAFTVSLTKMMNGMTSGIDKKLDTIVDTLHRIEKKSGKGGGGGNFGKLAESVDKFTDAMKNVKELKDTRIGRFVGMLNALKAVTLKDLLMFKPKMKLIESFIPKVNSMAKDLKEKDVKKVSAFIKACPELMQDMIKTIALSKLIKEKHLQRIVKLFGIGEKKPGPDTVLGFMKEMGKVKKKDLDDALKNARKTSDTIKAVCMGVGLLALFSPVIIVAAIIVKPLEWALFGFKGNGGIVGLMKKLGDKEKEIKKGNKSILWLSLGMAALGAGLGLLFGLTKNVKFIQLVKIAIATITFAAITMHLGEKKDKIKEGAEAMVYLGAGLFCVGIGLGVLFGLTRKVTFAQIFLSAIATVVFAKIMIHYGEKKDELKDGMVAMVYLGAGLAVIGLGLWILYTSTRKITLEQMICTATGILMFGIVSAILGKMESEIKGGAKSMLWMGAGLASIGIGMWIILSATRKAEPEDFLMIAGAILGFGIVTCILGEMGSNIKEGAKAMLWMSLGLGVLGLSLGLLFYVSKDVTLEQALILGGSIIFLAVVTVIMGQLNKQGLVLEGSIAMAIMGACLLPFSISLAIMMSAVKGLKWSEFGMFALSILILGGAVIGLGALMCSGFGAVAWLAGCAAIGTLGVSLLPFAISLKILSSTAKEIKPDEIKNMTDGIKLLFKSLVEVASKKERKNAEKNARALGRIGRHLKKLGKSLKTFNDLGPDSVDKCIDALDKIAKFFFSEDGINKYQTGFLKRMKAQANAGTIGTISLHLKIIANSLKTFNDVAGDSIDKAITSLDKIANYFFGTGKGTINEYTIGFFKAFSSMGKVGTIGLIAQHMKALSSSLKTFNDVGPGSIDKAMSAVRQIADFFFSEDSVLNKVGTGWLKRKKAEKDADTIGVISESLFKMSQGLKDFNDIGYGEIEVAEDAMLKIATFFFDENSSLNKLNVGWRQRKKTEKTADTIGVISDSLYKVSQALKDFNDLGTGAVNTMTATVDKIAECCFSNRWDELDKNTFKNVGKCLAKLGEGFKEFDEETKDINIENLIAISNSVPALMSLSSGLRELSTSFDGIGANFILGTSMTRRLFRQMSKVKFAGASRTIGNTARLVDKINTLDVERVAVLTDLFKSFSRIGSSSSVFGNFGARVKEFTDACLTLVGALNGNTDALNSNDDMVTVKDEKGQEQQVSRKEAEFMMPKRMMLMNVADLAAAIAEELNSLNVDCDTNINLQINSESGNEWRITRV